MIVIPCKIAIFGILLAFFLSLGQWFEIYMPRERLFYHLVLLVLRLNSGIKQCVKHFLELFSYCSLLRDLNFTPPEIRLLFSPHIIDHFAR